MLCICANMRVVCVRCMNLLCAVDVLHFICVLCVCKLAVAFSQEPGQGVYGFDF